MLSKCIPYIYLIFFLYHYLITEADFKFLPKNLGLGLDEGINTYESKEISYNYTPMEKSAVCSPSEAIRVPETVEEIQSIIYSAIVQNKTVKAFGSRHSASDIICTDGIPIDMKNINHMSYNEVDKTITVGSGALLNDIGEFLHKKNRSLRITPNFGGLSLGGVVGTDSHGSSLKFNSSISQILTSLTIIDGLGIIRKISKKADLQAFRTHLGLLGIIIDLTLETVPQFKIKIHNYLMSDDILINGQAIEMAKREDTLFFYWFPSFSQVVVSNGSFLHVDEYGDDGDLEALNIIQKYSQKSLYDKIPDYPPVYYSSNNNKTLANPGIGFSHRMFISDCSMHRFSCLYPARLPLPFRQIDQEMSIDINRFEEVINYTKSILLESPAAFPLQGITIKFSKSSDHFMSNSYGQDSFSLEWFIPKRESEYIDSPTTIDTFQAMMQAYAFKFCGRSHWGKSGLAYHSEPMITMKFRQNPSARKEFINYMKKYDPNGIFLNKFGARILGTGSKIDLDPRSVHCAINENCICSKNDDCSPNYVCSNLNSYPSYNVCMKRSGRNIALLATNPHISNLNITDFFHYYTNATSIFFYLYFYLSNL